MKLKYLNRHATSLLMCGIAFSTSAVLFLALCGIDSSEQQMCKHLEKHAESMGNSEHVGGKLNIFLLIMILSSPQGKEQRDTIRQTWLQLGNGNYTHRFFVGVKNLSPEVHARLRLEQSKYHDLVLLQDLEDSYTKLTSKMLKSLVWADAHSHFQYVLKGDEDSFVRVDKIYDELWAKPSRRLYWGFLSGSSHVIKHGSWKEAEWKLCDRYLPYAKGGGYVLSHDLVHFVANNAHYLRLYVSEDVSLGSWLAPVDLNYIHDYRFDTEYKSRGCSNEYLITHKQTMDMLREKYQNIKSTGKLCSREVKLRNGYIYNWKAVPSKCCDRSDNSIP